MLTVPHFSCGHVNIRSDQITAPFFFLFLSIFTCDREFVGCGYEILISASLNTTKANLGFGGTFTNLIGASPNPAIRA